MIQPEENVDLSTWIIAEKSLVQIGKLFLLALVCASLLTWATSYTFINLLFTLPLVCGLYWVSHNYEIRQRGAQHRRTPSRTRVFRHDWTEGSEVDVKSSAAPAVKDREAWRKKVNARVVEDAWELFCGHLIQEWVYDAWYCSLTPDREFPAQLRAAMHDWLGNAAQRARRVDLRTLIAGDVVALFIEQLSAYRAIKESLGETTLRNMNAAATDRAFKHELKADGLLHPALCSPDGHYKVLSRIAKMLVSLLVDKDDRARPLLAILSRELLASCVLRPVLLQFMPYSVNKWVLMFLNSLPACSRGEDGGSTAADVRRNEFEFEQRAREFAAEEVAAESRRMKRQQQRMRSGIRSTVMQRIASSTEVERMHVHRKSNSVESVPWSSTSQHAQHSKASQLHASQSSSALQLRAGHKPSASAGASLESAVMSTSQPSLPVTPVTSRFAADHAPQHAAQAAATPQHSTPATAVATPLEHRASTQWGAPPGRTGFVGYPTAIVVHSDLKLGGGGGGKSKQYVAFNIRVGDRDGEWTIIRRYRNFEAFHNRMKQLPAYKSLGKHAPQPPPKRVLRSFQSSDTAFVDKRREKLNEYLTALLRVKDLAFDAEMWEFLANANSELYSLQVDGFLSSVSSSGRSGMQKVGTAASAMARRIGSVMSDRASPQSAAYDKAASTPPLYDVPRLSHDYKPQPYPPASESPMSSPTQPSSPYTPFHRDRSTASDQADTSAAHLAASIASSADDTDAVQSPFRTADISADHVMDSVVDAAMTSAVLTATQHASSTARASDGTQHGGTFGTDHADADVSERTAAEHTGNISLQSDAETAELLDLPNFRSIGGDGESGPAPLDWDPEQGDVKDRYFITSSIAELADVIFDLQSQGVLRRQVVAFAIQLGTLIIGEGLDKYVMNQLRLFRTQHAIARCIHTLRRSLWPGGVWCANVAPPPLSRERPQALTAEAYLAFEPPPDAELLAHMVKEKLLGSGGAARQRMTVGSSVINRRNFEAGLHDVYDMLQLSTFTLQLGYGVLEIVLTALFPEMLPFFQSMQQPDAPRTSAA